MLTILPHYDPTVSSLSDLDRQDLINYEYEMFEKGIPQVQPTLSHIDKFAEWHLDAKISQLVGSARCKVRWIGNTPTSHLSAYVYILLVITEHNTQSLLHFKHTVYGLAKRCLSVSQQKIIVEFFYLIEYARDRHSFLNKYPQIQGIMIKLLEFVEEEHLKNQTGNQNDFSIALSPQHPDRKSTMKHQKHTLNLSYRQSNLFQGFAPTMQELPPPEAQAETARQKSSSVGMSFSSRLAQMGQQMESFKQLHQLYQLYNRIFPFLSLLHCNQHSYTFQLFRKTTVYVVVEKHCFFILQPVSSRPDSNGINFTLGGKQRREDFVRRSQTDSRTGSRAINDSQHIEPGDHSMIETLLGGDQKQPVRAKSEIEESKVIRIDRGSQIRSNKKARKYTMNTLSAAPPQQEKKSSSIIMKNESKMTFIDELLNQVSLNDMESLKHVQRSQMFEQTLSQIVHQQAEHPKINSIKQIKGQLQKLRQKLEKKLTAKFPSIMKTTPTNSEHVQGKKILGYGSADKLDIFRKEEIRAQAIKKDRKFSYNCQLNGAARPKSPILKPKNSFGRKISLNNITTIPQTASAKTLPPKPSSPLKTEEKQPMQKSMVVKNKQRAALWEKLSRDKAKAGHHMPECVETQQKQTPGDHSFHVVKIRSPQRAPVSHPSNPNMKVSVTFSSSPQVPQQQVRNQYPSSYSPAYSKQLNYFQGYVPPVVLQYKQ